MFPSWQEGRFLLLPGKLVCLLCKAVFLGVFAKLWKVTISFVMSVCPSAWNNTVPSGRVVMKFYASVFFKNLSGKFKFH